jgi:hypothetical protein
MKTTTRILPLAIALLSSLTLQAGDNHSHEKKVAGPNGGRILTTIEPHAEFFVTADRKVQITFVDDEGKAIAPAQQIVIVTTGERSAPVKMTFAKNNNVLVSDQSVPAGNNFPVVVQVKTTPDAKTLVEKFTLNFSNCPDCKLAEYACICAHAH